VSWWLSEVDLARESRSSSDHIDIDVDVDVEW